jgi:acetaldehyde dehydrogenase / alcohol dehydrogenase
MGTQTTLREWRDRAVDVTSPERMDEIDAAVARAAEAATAFRRLDQDQVDRIVWAMTVAGLEAATELAVLATEETRFGVLEDKVIKNYVATEFLYDHLKDKRTVGVIERDPHAGIDIVAEPVGVVLAVTPVTNPTSTVLFKAIVAAKTRNAIVFRPSPHAIRCAERVVELLATAGEAAGLPPGALQVIPDREHEVSHYLWRHDAVDLTWTTGGPGVVRAANQAGKPSISVSSGNAPFYVHRSADVGMAVVDLLISKTFDASVICPAEQTAIVDEPVYDRFLAELERLGGVRIPDDAVPRLAEVAFGCDGRMDLGAVGRPAAEIAARIGVEVPPTTKVLLAPLPSDLDELAAHPLVREKLMPVLGLVRSPDLEHGVAAAVVVTEHGGLGHTSAIYARDEDAVDAFSREVRTGRILVNAPTAVGALGGVYNSLTPTFSLGCGTWGGSLTTDNVNYRQLLNLKTVSRRKAPPQWFRVPSDTYFNAGALESLADLDARSVVIVTDPDGAARGVVDAVRAHLTVGSVRVFAEVEPEPGIATVRAGVAMLDQVQPEVIIAVGGGSVLDAAKVMRLLHEHPTVDLDELMLPFLDPRKRVAQYPSMDHTVRLVAIPTTAGTGSEVSPGAVITVGDRKATLVDYSLLPDRAIVDPELTLSLPPSVTADSGVDALTHALEAAVSIFASPFTDAFCVQATRLILDALPRAVEDGSDLEARTMMADAATLAGLAFSNAFLGVNHALAHAVGARFHLAHGRANAIFLPHVLRYNAGMPSKFMPAPGYGAYVAPEKYAQLGYVLFGGRTDEDRRARLFGAVDELLATLGMPRTLKEAGVEEADFEAALPDLIAAAASDPSLRTNPRMPLLTELSELFHVAFHGSPSPS